MAEKKKALATKSDKLSSILKAHRVEGQNLPLQGVHEPPYVHHDTHAYTNRHTQKKNVT